MEAKTEKITTVDTTDTRENPRPFTALLFFRKEEEGNATVLRAEYGMGLPQSCYVYVDQEDDSRNGIREGWNLVWVSIKLTAGKAYARIVKKEDALRYRLQCLVAQQKLAEAKAPKVADTSEDEKTVLAMLFAKNTPYTDRKSGNTTVKPIFKYGQGIGGRGGHTVFVHKDALDMITNEGWYLCVLNRSALRLKYSFAKPYLVSQYIAEIIDAMQAQLTRCGYSMSY
ncbi:hypothetical protein HOB10_01080 [Candidatus Parcubacteria bacterium]|jgi:hypothetical protein|nr:hypothetical protein [Candidatus Parcubacteria bacterium]